MAFEQLRAARLWLQRYGRWLPELGKPPVRKRRAVPRRELPAKPAPPAPAPAPPVAALVVPEGPRPQVNAGGLPALIERYQACLRCRRYGTRTMVVFGRGAARADLMLLGAAPSAQADQTGALFAGPAGALLERMVERGMELPIESVYLTTLLKCFAGEQAPLQADEVAACSELLQAQLACVKPRVLCVLGLPAAQALLRTELPLEELRGRWHSYAGVPVRVSYDPGWLEGLPAREARPAKRAAWQDLKAVVQRIAALRGGSLLPW